MSIPDTLSDMRAMLRGKASDIDIGPHCDDPYECDFKDHCWKHLPEQSKHFEYLAGPGEDPRKEMAEKLLGI